MFFVLFFTVMAQDHLMFFVLFFTVMVQDHLKLHIKEIVQLTFKKNMNGKK